MSSTLLGVDLSPASPIEVTYSPRATKPRPGQISPPIPGTEGFRTVRGRSGDLIVIQLRSGEHLTPKRRAALRTIGLHGIRTAVLRRSNDASFWGSARRVRDVIAIIELPELVYGWDAGNASQTETDIKVENPIPYGTPSRPGSLWRSTHGDYFGFEYEADRLFGYWSTALSFSDVSGGFVDLGLAPNGGDSYIAVRIGDAVEHFRGRWEAICKHVGGDAVASLASIAVDDSSRIIWKEPHVRFHDMETVRAELGIVSSPADAFLTRSLARTTANALFLDAAGCEVQYRAGGRTRKVPI